jgi:hypothetical protein
MFERDTMEWLETIIIRCAGSREKRAVEGGDSAVNLLGGPDQRDVTMGASLKIKE